MAGQQAPKGAPSTLHPALPCSCSFTMDLCRLAASFPQALHCCLIPCCCVVSLPFPSSHPPVKLLQVVVGKLQVVVSMPICVFMARQNYVYIYTYVHVCINAIYMYKSCPVGHHFALPCRPPLAHPDHHLQRTSLKSSCLSPSACHLTFPTTPNVSGPSLCSDPCLSKLC